MALFSVRVLDEAPHVLAVRGEIDISTAEEFRDALREATADGTVVVDLGEVSFIDLAGLRVLLAVGAARNGKGPLTLRNAERVAWLLDLVGVDGDDVSLNISDGA